MELTSQQKRIINRYALMPTFLQKRRLNLLFIQLHLSREDEAEVVKMLFERSTEQTKKDAIRTFLLHGNIESQEVVRNYFGTLSPSEQEEIIQKGDEYTVREVLGDASPELQEKYIEKYLSSDFFITTGRLTPEVKRNHLQEFLDKNVDQHGLIREVWPVLSPEEKGQYFGILLEHEYSYETYWKDLEAQYQEQYMPELIQRVSETSMTSLNFWQHTKREVQHRYISDIINTIMSKDNYSWRSGKAHDLETVWKNTRDSVQNSTDGRRAYNRVLQEEKIDLYEFTNSKLQSQILADDVKKYLHENSSEWNQLKRHLSQSKEKVFEMNFPYFFNNLSTNLEYLRIFLEYCPEDVRKRYSSMLEAYFTTNLRDFMYNGENSQYFLITGAEYLETEVSINIIENIVNQGLDKTKKINQNYLRQFDGETIPTVLDKYWEKMGLAKQKEALNILLENRRLEDKIDIFYNLTNFENHEEEREYFEKYFDTYHPEAKDKALQRFDTIYTKNNTIAKTINLKFMSSDLIDSLTEEQLLRITHYPEAQEKLVGNTENEVFIKAFFNMLETNENWTLPADYIFKNIDSEEYDKLLANIEQSNLDPQYYNNLCIALSKPNYFGLETAEDIEKYFEPDGKRTQMLMAIMRGERVELPTDLAVLSPEDLKKFAVSEYLYGMDLQTLQEYENRFKGINQLNTQGKEYIQEFISQISELNNQSQEELDKQIADILNGRKQPTEYSRDIHLESKAINLFCQEFTNGLFTPEKDGETAIEPVTVNGKEIEVHRIHGEFKMLARVEGAYNPSFKGVEDYRAFYDHPSLDAHGNCESIIGQDQIGLARNRNGNIVVGYAEVPPSSILVSAPYDLSTRNKSLAPLHDKLYYDIAFNGLQETIDRTRHTHNETVMERLIVKQDGSVEKLKPSYILWVEDRKTDKFPPTFVEPPEDNEEEQLKYESQKHLWEETQKAAEQLGIPIVIINREECAELEMAKIEEMQKMIRGEEPLPEGKTKADIFREALTKFENNSVGLEFAVPEVQAKYFTQSQREELIQAAMDSLEQIPETAYEERYEYLSQITSAIAEEDEKNTLKGVKSKRDAIAYYSEQAKLMEDKLEKYKGYIGKEHDIEIDVPEESKAIFESDVRSISSTDIYKGNEAHSIEHIEKVMLFASVLAHNEGLNPKDTEVLMASAAFHDSFRNGNDGHAPHAEGSARVAKEYFQANPQNPYNINPEDIPLMQVAIEYHEHDEQTKGKVDRAEIGKLCEKYGYRGDIERAVQISTILKDADALDRARFAKQGRLSPEYLRTQTAKSKEMILFAQKVNGKYASRMLARNYGEQAGEFESVEQLRAKRIQRARETPNDRKEHTLTTDEMLTLFSETSKEYTREVSDIDKKKGLIKAFEETTLSRAETERARSEVTLDKATSIDQSK